MRKILTLLACLAALSLSAQDARISGQLQDPDGAPVLFANVILYNAVDSSLVKVETTDENGDFVFQSLQAGTYTLEATYVGLGDLEEGPFELAADQKLELGVLGFRSAAIELEGATITASRTMVEVKPDRTVFNVEGTINSTGSDAMNLLRKAPGVTVDNNDNVNVLGRAGVLLYVDGKRLPLVGEELTNYLQNLPADQIDRIEIITSPGAKYEAEGNAGIIDIRLKKDKNLGGNGSVSGTSSQGRYNRSNLNASGNYRNKWMNVFAGGGWGQGANYNSMLFRSYQNGLFLDEINRSRGESDNYNYRFGADFFLGDRHTVGFLVNGGAFADTREAYNRIEISPLSMPEAIDSILIASNTADNSRTNQTYNVNYRFDNRDGQTLNVDLDYGRYENRSERYQPNQYYDADEEQLLSEIINAFDTPTDIDIYTARLDFEDKLFGGTFGAGAKFSRVVSDNTFLFFDVIDEENVQNDRNSNEFEYTENVYAGYLNYARSLSDQLSFSAGLRAEQTDATGDLIAFLPELQEDPVELNYLSWFPSAGLTYTPKQGHTLALNYGRRINRPDYNVLNPFNNQISQLSYSKGNPFLRPEIVNNVELGYTLKYMYNFKLSYSKTIDQITRLMGPDELDPRAGFITWDNLAQQTIFSLNVSAPIQIKPWWNFYINAGASYLDNQADYGEGAVVDVQAFTYNFYQQHTFNLPWKLKGEVSGYYSGPGVWGGVFRYESNWSLDLGLQRKFLNDQLMVRISASDLFYQTGWDGESEFDGLISEGSGRWDSRRAAISISYRFGNQNVKSRKRQTGLEDEAGRVGQ
jgi:iron complex outermembrane receptor protein